MFNINYNNSDKCFYSFDTFGGKPLKKITSSEVIDLFHCNASSLFEVRNRVVLFVTVKQRN